MKSLGVVICNYNKSNYVLNCINSVFNSTFQDMDIYVVDNASIDDSVQRINQEYGTKLTLLENKENLGGSGGFNTGIQKALEKDYKYIMCIDNDIILKEDAIENLYKFLESTPEVGMAASKILIMDQPDTIQTFGAMIDFQNYNIIDCFRNEKDDGHIPSVQYCDYVPACALMVRSSIIHQIGMMPEENFIYWDDMEWGYRVNLSGNKVAACSNSIVWHKGGAVSGNTFWKYYQYRNRISFFIRYLPQNKLKTFGEFILKEIYRQVFGCYEKRDINTIKALMFALDDALNQNKGKAKEGRILERNPLRNPLAELLKGKEQIVLVVSDKNFLQENEINICIRNIENLSMKKIQKIMLKDLNNFSYDLVLHYCKHVYEIKDGNPLWQYVDAWNNCIATTKDYYRLTGYSDAENRFLSIYENLFEFHAKKISEEFHMSNKYNCLKTII